jgi:hypothetical protein
MYETVFSATGWAGAPGSPISTGVAAPIVPPFGHRDRLGCQADEGAGGDRSLVDERHRVNARTEQRVADENGGVHAPAEGVDLKDDRGDARRRRLVEHALDERREPEVDDTLDSRHEHHRPRGGPWSLGCGGHGQQGEQPETREEHEDRRAPPGAGACH